MSMEFDFFKMCNIEDMEFHTVLSSANWLEVDDCGDCNDCHDCHDDTVTSD